MARRKRENQVNIRLSDYEYSQLTQEADKLGISLSDMVRRLISQLPEPKDDSS